MSKLKLRWIILLALVAAGIGLAWPGKGYSSSSVREASRQAVQDCFARTAPGTSRTVTREMRFLCRKDASDPSRDLYQGDRIEYRISRGESGFTLQADVPLDVQPSRTTAARKRQILEMTQACMPTINQFWSHYGIQLDFNFSLLQGPASAHANTVTVTDAPGRSNSRNFFYEGLDTDMRLPTGQSIHGGPGVACVTQCRSFAALAGDNCAALCEPAREKEYCLMMLHELGHRLGLPDEYADPMCPDREFVSQESYPWSIMAVPYPGILDTAGVLDTGLAEFFPRHMETVLAPVCPR